MFHRKVLSKAIRRGAALGEAIAFAIRGEQELLKFGSDDRERHERSGPTQARVGIGNPGGDLRVIIGSGSTKGRAHSGLTFDLSGVP